MIKKLLFIFSIAIVSFSYEDLGTYGEMYEIKERDFMVVLKEREAELDKNALEKEYMESAKRSLHINSKFTSCFITRTREYEPLIKLEKDVVVPYTNEVIQKKGTYNILEQNRLTIPYNIIFLNVDNPLEVELAELYKKRFKHKIRILVVKGDYMKFISNPLFANAKVARQKFEAKAFNLECTPSIYTQQNNKFLISEYNTQELLKDEK